MTYTQLGLKGTLAGRVEFETWLDDWSDKDITVLNKYKPTDNYHITKAEAARL